MKINTTNIEAIAYALNPIQAKSRVRTISHLDVANAVLRIEKFLANYNIPKKDWKGLVFNVDCNAQSFPNAYKGIPESTQFVVERGSKDWFITSMSRARTNTKYTYLLHPCVEGFKKLVAENIKTDF